MAATGQRLEGKVHGYGAATAERRFVTPFAELADESAAVVPRATLGQLTFAERVRRFAVAPPPMRQFSGAFLPARRS